MQPINKEEVLNPITLFNTIGQEIEEILIANNVDKSDFLRCMEWDGKEFQSMRKISLKKMRLVETFLNIEGLNEYLDSFQKNYLENELKAKESFKKNKKIFTSLKPVLSLLRNDFNEGIDLLADISDFFGVEDESEIFNIAETNVARYRAPNFEPDIINLFAWLRRGTLDFEQMQLTEYNRNALELWIHEGEWKENLNSKEYFSTLPKIFQSFGIGLVFTQHLPKTVFGAVRWINQKPLIQISDREKNLATCWYTLFHEIGHVLLHVNEDICEGSINESKRKTNKKESEANSFASEHLFGGDGLRKYIFDYQSKSVSDSFIEETSQKFNINKMLVGYWMKKAQVSNLNITSHIPKVAFS